MEVVTSSSTGTALENLYPALTQCFVIIICGYFAGRMNLISETEAKGINTFVGTFSLPSLIFMSLATLDLSSVNWLFLLAILMAKSLVFFAVILVTLAVGRPVNLGRSGIFAIFCTQSNDFAIGYPIVAALYKSTHPDYAGYLYLMAPISLAILNPIAFVLMEVGRYRETPHLLLNEDIDEMRPERLKVVISIIKNIFLNPIIMMTLLGILGNFIFHHTIPCYMAAVLEALGSAFSASALFLLGLRMVGKVHKLRGAALVAPGILIMVKLVALPLVTREVVSAFRPGANATETSDLSTYGFLYGTFPSAPTVFVFASQYGLDVDLIASAMVACTFISAPLMFISAKMITLQHTAPSDYIRQLDAFTFDISVAAIIATCWVLTVFVLTKKIIRIPHRITACLIVSQLLSCTGAILWNTLGMREGFWRDFQFAIFTVGIYATRIWTAILAFVMLALQCRGLCFVLKLQPYYVVIGWGLPIVLSSILLFTNDPDNDTPFEKRNPNFAYGVHEAILTVCLLTLCFIVTAGCMIFLERYRRRISLIPTLDVDENSTTNALLHDTDRNRSLPTIDEDGCEDDVVDIEDLAADDGLNRVCSSRFGCRGSKRETCEGLVRQYRAQGQTYNDLEDIEVDDEDENGDPQLLRHVVLLVLLLTSMFIGLALSIWTLVMDKMSGIYIELSFIDATLNFGQSLIVFAIFGLDTKEILIPLLRIWRKMGVTTKLLRLPAYDQLDNETRHICDQFLTHHKEHCQESIASDRRWRLKVYKNVFTGHELVDWLIEVGVARDRGEGIQYARHLIDGRILKHINGVYHFYDRNLLYRFI